MILGLNDYPIFDEGKPRASGDDPGSASLTTKSLE